MWFGWVTDFGLPGPDRAQGGRYLLVGPGYEGPLPDNGYFVSHVRTTRAALLGRAFMIDNDPAPAVKIIRDGLRIHPYAPGAYGTAVASYLAGDEPLGQVPAPTETRFVEGSGVSFNTIPPNDFGYWELINDVVQQEPVEAAGPETLGLLASIGIVKGKPFAPDDRMRKILEDAVTVGNATARTVSFGPRPEEGFAYYPDSQWINSLFVGGYQFLDPPPELTADGPVASPQRRSPQAQRADRLLLPVHGHHPRHVHAPHRDRLAVPLRHAGRRRRVPRRRPQLQDHACPPTSPSPASGPSCSTTARRARCCRPASRSPMSGARAARW